MKEIRSESKSPTEIPTDNSVVELQVANLDRPKIRSQMLSDRQSVTESSEFGKIIGQIPTDGDRIFGHSSLL